MIFGFQIQLSPLLMKKKNVTFLRICLTGLGLDLDKEFPPEQLHLSIN